MPCVPVVLRVRGADRVTREPGVVLRDPPWARWIWTCGRCGAEIMWIDTRGTPAPRCPIHAEVRMIQVVLREEYESPGEQQEADDKQGDLFGGGEKRR